MTTRQGKWSNTSSQERLKDKPSPSLTPNTVTLLSLPVALIAALFLSQGRFFLAAFWLILLGGCDLLDGYLARTKKLDSPFGAFLDSTIDRLTELLVYFGILVLFLRKDPCMAAVTYGVMGGSFVISYARARAEKFVENARVGFWERPERMVLLFLGLLLGRLEASLWILLFGVAQTATHRILHTYQALQKISLIPFQKILFWDFPRTSWPYRLLAFLVIAFTFLI